jgi:protein with PEP-CTERM/exosortase system signal
MKPTTPSFKLLPALIVTIITAWSAHSALGSAIPTLTLTEVSSTELDYSWDAAGGGSSGKLTDSTPNHWLALPISGPTLGVNTGLTGDWKEPEAPTSQCNIVDVSFISGSWKLGVVSEAGFPGTIENGRAVTSPNFDLVFNDNGDAPVAGVPDTGTTASLLGFSLAGLAFLRRKLC